MASPIRSSGRSSSRYRVSSAAVATWLNNCHRMRSATPWYRFVWARITSPERGSTTSPPELADRTGEATKRSTEFRASSRLNSGSSSSVGARRTSMAFRKPACSNPSFHSRMPASTYGTHSSGVAGSMYHTHGLIGSTNSPRRKAAVSEGSSRYRTA